MALLTVEKFTQKDPKNQTSHNKTTAEYLFFDDETGKRYFQIDTYGTDTREYPGKVSQSIQLDEEMAQRLINILRTVFDLNQK